VVVRGVKAGYDEAVVEVVSAQERAMRTFEYSDARSHKFWNIERTGNAFTVTFGRIGSKGRSQTKEFPSEEGARAAADKLIAEKLAKGYRETTPATPAPSLREAFERAILDEPDDPAGYAAYADWLQEQGDPRGEFLHVQLALEDESRPASERRALQARERELLDRHERAWLGGLAAHLLDRDRASAPLVEYRWRGGFLSTLNVQCLTMAFAQDLADAASARFLRELRVHGEARYSMDEGGFLRVPRVAVPAGVRGHWELIELIGAPCLRGLRVFQMGDVDVEPPDGSWGDCHTYAPGLEHVIAGPGPGGGAIPVRGGR
jgi:uncharacterized protein (TIGR02996 family)